MKFVFHLDAGDRVRISQNGEVLTGESLDAAVVALNGGTNPVVPMPPEEMNRLSELEAEATKREREAGL